MTTDIDALIEAMTLDEKTALTAGVNLWYLPPLPRLGLPALKVSDGPSGVRGDSLIGRRSLSLPCGMAVGSTWNPELAGRLGDVLAAEAVAKNARVLLGPTVCIVRTPLAGRTFESFSEDPLLTSRLAVAYVRGVQSHGVACCIKHFACNDQEHERMSISATVDERTLHELHLVAFEAAVGQAEVWAVMTAYNKVNGVYCGEQPDLIDRVLRGHWGFDGLVISDWFGTHSTAPAAQAGLDLEMPGPPAWFGPSLAAAVRAGQVDESVVDTQVRHLLTLMSRVGLLENADPAASGTAVPFETTTSEKEEDEPWRRAVARQVATEGTVLLVNDGLLPVDPGTVVGQVAVIGPNAGLLAMGGGSSEVTPHRRRRVADVMAERFSRARVVYEEGCRIDKGLPTLDIRLLDGEGYQVEYFDNPERSGDPVATEVAHNGRMTWVGLPHPALTEGAEHSVRISGQFTPDVSGPWDLGLESAGRSTLRVDGDVVIDNTEPERGAGFYGAGSTVVRAEYTFESGQTYALVMEVWPRSNQRALLGARLAAAPPWPTDAFDRAVAAAAESDLAVVVVGLNGSWESEGFDRPDLALPGDQDRLVEAVLDANPRTIVVVNAGSPVDLPWADRAAAVLLCWFPGEEGADALGDIVVGLSEPSGRLPVTFPRSLADGPTGGAAETYPGVDGTVVYNEGLLVGYRHHLTRNIAPRFCFGHGLSYGDISYDKVHIAPGGVSVDLVNRGTRTGTEVVQIYLRGEQFPIRLAGFAKVRLEAGQDQVVEITLGDDAYQYWSTTTHAWARGSGTFEVVVGSSSEAIAARKEVTRS